jgi:hypothetical protein
VLSGILAAMNTRQPNGQPDFAPLREAPVNQGIPSSSNRASPATREQFPNLLVEVGERAIAGSEVTHLQPGLSAFEGLIQDRCAAATGLTYLI